MRKEHFTRAGRIQKFLRYHLYSSIGRIKMDRGKKHIAERYYRESRKSEMETYFSIVSSQKISKKDISYMISTWDKVFFWRPRFARERIA